MADEEKGESATVSPPPGEVKGPTDTVELVSAANLEKPRESQLKGSAGEDGVNNEVLGPGAPWFQKPGQSWGSTRSAGKGSDVDSVDRPSRPRGLDKDDFGSERERRGGAWRATAGTSSPMGERSKGFHGRAPGMFGEDEDEDRGWRKISSRHQRGDRDHIREDRVRDDRHHRDHRRPERERDGRGYSRDLRADYPGSADGLYYAGGGAVGGGEDLQQMRVAGSSRFAVLDRERGEDEREYSGFLERSEFRIKRPNVIQYSKMQLLTLYNASLPYPALADQVSGVYSDPSLDPCSVAPMGDEELKAKRLLGVAPPSRGRGRGRGVPPGMRGEREPGGLEREPRRNKPLWYDEAVPNEEFSFAGEKPKKEKREKDDDRSEQEDWERERRERFERERQEKGKEREVSEEDQAAPPAREKAPEEPPKESTATAEVAAAASSVVEPTPKVDEHTAKVQVPTPPAVARVERVEEKVETVEEERARIAAEVDAQALNFGSFDFESVFGQTEGRKEGSSDDASSSLMKGIAAIVDEEPLSSPTGEARERIVFGEEKKLEQRLASKPEQPAEQQPPQQPEQPTQQQPPPLQQLPQPQQQPQPQHRPQPPQEQHQIQRHHAAPSLPSPPVSPFAAFWKYRDPRGMVQGPFVREEMREWYLLGYFNPQLSVHSCRVDGSYGDEEELISLVREHLRRSGELDDEDSGDEWLHVSGKQKDPRRMFDEEEARRIEAVKTSGREALANQMMLEEAEWRQVITLRREEVGAIIFFPLWEVFTTPYGALDPFAPVSPPTPEVSAVRPMLEQVEADQIQHHRAALPALLPILIPSIFPLVNSARAERKKRRAVQKMVERQEHGKSEEQAAKQVDVDALTDKFGGALLSPSVASLFSQAMAQKPGSREEEEVHQPVTWNPAPSAPKPSLRTIQSEQEKERRHPRSAILPEPPAPLSPAGPRVVEGKMGERMLTAPPFEAFLPEEKEGDESFEDRHHEKGKAKKSKRKKEKVERRVEQKPFSPPAVVSGQVPAPAQKPVRGVGRKMGWRDLTGGSAKPLIEIQNEERIRQQMLVEREQERERDRLEKEARAQAAAERRVRAPLLAAPSESLHFPPLFDAVQRGPVPKRAAAPEVQAGQLQSPSEDPLFGWSVQSSRPVVSSKPVGWQTASAAPVQSGLMLDAKQFPSLDSSRKHESPRQQAPLRGVSEAFFAWTLKELKSLVGNDDPALAAFLCSLQSGQEVEDYLASYFRNSAQAARFGQEFVARRRQEGVSSHESPVLAPADSGSIAPRHYNPDPHQPQRSRKVDDPIDTIFSEQHSMQKKEGNQRRSKKAGGRGVQRRKIDPSFLGFSTGTPKVKLGAPN